MLTTPAIVIRQDQPSVSLPR